MEPPANPNQQIVQVGTVGEVFFAFLKLGLTSFGGPIAHLGYFRDELVVRRNWISEQGFLDLVALCQFLPGPASSQTGFAMGLLRAGPLGALAAWTAFTLPSALALVLFAGFTSAFEVNLGGGILHGLKIAAIAVVAQAVWSMGRNFCKDLARILIAVAAFVVLTLWTMPVLQIMTIGAGALAGLLFFGKEKLPETATTNFAISRRVGAAALVLFFTLLLLLPLIASVSSVHGVAVIDAFYRTGALVFGGGHVVLPLLEHEVVQSGWIASSDFLAGYGAAQAVPGPLFSFASYLGALLQTSPNGVPGATLALVAIFLPGMLLIVGVLPFWSRLQTYPAIRAAMSGANAAVVGLLGAALYNPLWVGTITGVADVLIAAAAFALLMIWRTPPWIVVALCAVGGVALSV